MEKWEKYIDDVHNRKIKCCNYVHLSIERHLNDLKRLDIYFDKQAAIIACTFIESLSLGRKFDEFGNVQNKLFTLTPFQSFIVASLFGWKLTRNNKRRFRYAYCEMSRKQGKSTLAAAIAILFFIIEYNAEVYTIATKRDQARIVFDKAKQIITQTDFLKKEIQVQQHVITIKKNFSKFEPLSSDSKKQDGLGPSCTICDEFHEHPNDLMYNVMKSGSGARSEPLLFTITTAGFNKLSACYELRNSCIQILEGQIKDDSTFSLIFTLDDNDDWENEANWIKPNPNLNITVDIEFLRQEYNQAKNIPSQIVNFQTKNLNVWTQTSAVWIKDKDWQSCPSEIDYESLKGMPCYGGLDLSKTVDMTALCIVFPNPEKEIDNMDFKVIWKYWLPEAAILQNRDNMNYTRWVEEGYINATPGREVDYEYIIKEIADIYTKYNVIDIAYDPYMANASIVQGLEKKHSIILTTMPQGFRYLSAPTAFIENLVIGKKINHGGNPVSRWHCSNVELQTNPEGLVKMSKSKSKHKIDGMYALANALALWMDSREADYKEIIYI